MTYNIIIYQYYFDSKNHLLNIKEVSFGGELTYNNCKTNNFILSLTIHLHNNVVCTKYLLKIKIYNDKNKYILCFSYITKVEMLFNLNFDF